MEMAAEVRNRIAEVLDLADHDVLDVTRSRAVEQEALDLLDEPNPVKSGWQSTMKNYQRAGHPGRSRFLQTDCGPMGGHGPLHSCDVS